MSIALGQKLNELERTVLELSRDLTDTMKQLAQLQRRLDALEARPRPGRPPKD